MLSSMLKLRISGRLIPCFRGSDELDYLHSWLRGRETDAPEKSGPVDIPAMIKGCSICGDGLEKKAGIGSGNSRVIIILNHPSLVSMDERERYRKESSEMMKKMIHSIGLDYRECYMTNLIKCEIRDSFLKPSSLLDACRGLLCAEINSMDPLVAIVMGDIIPMQKIVSEFSGIAWFNVDHPVTLIKNLELKKRAWSTLKLVMGKLDELNLR